MREGKKGEELVVDCLFCRNAVIGDDELVLGS